MSENKKIMEISEPQMTFQFVWLSEMSKHFTIICHLIVYLRGLYPVEISVFISRTKMSVNG